MTNLDKVTRRDINSSNIRFPIKDAYSAAFPRFTADDIVEFTFSVSDILLNFNTKYFLM